MLKQHPILTAHLLALGLPALAALHSEAALLMVCVAWLVACAVGLGVMALDWLGEWQGERTQERLKWEREHTAEAPRPRSRRAAL